MIFGPIPGVLPLRKLNQIYGGVIVMHHSLDVRKFRFSNIPLNSLSLCSNSDSPHLSVYPIRPLFTFNKDPKTRASNVHYEKIFTIPNVISMCRIGLTPILCYFVIKSNLFVALPLFTICAISDWVCDSLTCIGRWIHRPKAQHAKQAGHIFGSPFR